MQTNEWIHYFWSEENASSPVIHEKAQSQKLHNEVILGNKIKLIVMTLKGMFYCGGSSDSELKFLYVKIVREMLC